MTKEIWVLIISLTVALELALSLPAAAAENGSQERIELQYDENLVHHGFPNPMLRATVNGQEAWFIIDTGAENHTLATWLVKAARLKPQGRKKKLIGSTGITREGAAFKNVAVQFGANREISLREVIEAEFPGIFAEQRIGGLISPRLLVAGTAAAVLDLRVPDLRFEPFNAAVRELGMTADNAARVCPTGKRSSYRQYVPMIKVDGVGAPDVGGQRR
jgi:Aspartyl protease